MRVTKIIREYVEKTITSKLPYGEPSARYKEESRKLADLCDLLNEQMDAHAAELMKTFGGLPEGFVIKRTGYSMFTHSSYNSPLHCAASTHEQEIRKKRVQAIENILVELELGATKADLERLISEAINM